MSQPLITQFYNKRKRAAEGYASDFKSKVLKLDLEGKIGSGDGSSSSLGISDCDEIKNVAYCMQKEEHPKLSDKQRANTKCQVQSQPTNVSKPSAAKNSKRMPNKPEKCKGTSHTSKTDIRLAFRPKGLNNVCNISSKSSEVSEAKYDCSTRTNIDDKANSSTAENKVIFELCGGLSPKKKEAKVQESPRKHKHVNQNDDVKNARKELGLMTPKKITEQNSKALSLNDIRNKLNKSSRLTEIRESIKRFNKGEQCLKELKIQKKKIESASPRLREFKCIDLEVPVSPQKASSAVSTCSPCKASPIKSPLKSPLKASAYQRLAHLIQPGVPTLTLPYTYRMLAEIFRCVDTVISMVYNRRETVTFAKLKSGVQQMLRRNFTEQHLGQIKQVLPNAFQFSQEKCSTFASSKKNTYELVIIPVIDSEATGVSRITNGNLHSVMTSSLLVGRRESFHENLLNVVKDYHDEFLRNLNPPVHIPRSSIARWHPDFDLQQVPPVTPAELPVAPTEEKLCTAKDVLDRAKTLFGCNQRMEKALMIISEQMSKSELQPSATQVSNNSGSNSSLLKGIPKALLEKVRAKQAAKALLAMTRTPAEDHEAIQLGRLPEISRILRNIFVAEKKNVLSLEVALSKLSTSYREALSTAELQQHIHLLKKVVPGWVEILHVRKTDYIKISKDADMSAVMKKLEKLAAEKNADI